MTGLTTEGRQNDYSKVARVFNSSLGYSDSDSWDDSVVQLAFYEDGGNADTAGMGGCDG